MPGGGNRKTSKVWDAFTQLDDGKAKCDICGLSFSYKSSTTNLAKHLYRKHKSYRYTSLGNDEDPREGLREFIALDGEEVAGAEEERDDADGQLRDGDTEWTAPPRKLRKSASSVANKRIKPEVISSNGVDYVIYTHEQPRASAPTLIPARPLVPSTPTRATPAPTPTVRPHTASTAAEDEFTTFAKFLSQRIRSFKDPYWQSCAINEINIALHKVEMRRYEPPRSVPTSVVSVQTENFGLPVISHVSTHDSHDVVEEIVSHVEERC